MDAFDSDVLIYAAILDPRGLSVLGLFAAAEDGSAGLGSVLLIPEVLTKPTRNHDVSQRRALITLLSRLDLQPVNRAVVDLAVTVGVSYRLKALDATHLATAIAAGADRFITNNRRDFDATMIEEIDIVYPDQLVG